jgi:hypothetical protein
VRRTFFQSGSPTGRQGPGSAFFAFCKKDGAAVAGVTTSSNSTFLVVVIATHGTVYKSLKTNTHYIYIYIYTQRMSALSLSTPIHTASTLTNARVSSRRTRVSSIKASCSSITLGAPSSHGLKGLKMATQRNQVLMQPNRGKLQVYVEEKRTARALFYSSSSSSSSKFFFLSIEREKRRVTHVRAARWE